MATSPPSSPSAAVVDASILVALCAREGDRYAVARAQMRQYVRDGRVAYAPGVVVAETLFALCRKLQTSALTPDQHRRAIQHLRIRLRGIQPPPNGDASLAVRAEEIRGTFGCSRSADGLYIALAEELATVGPTELVTFDAAMPGHVAATAPAVTVRLLIAGTAVP